MKKEVRPIDANATIDALRANFQQGSWYGCEEPCYQIAEDTISEMPTLTDHFPDITKMVPLTLWELEDMEGQKVLLYRMKSTEPLEPGTVKQNGDVLGDASMLAYHELYLETWVAFSYQAQEKPDFDKPLTLEQLRGMDGQPVWVKVIGKTGIRCDGWCEVEIREKDPFAYVWWPGSEVEDIAKIEDYGKEWLAYPAFYLRG